MFANGSYATIWEIKKEEANYADVKISTSKKNKNGEYEQDFGGIVRFVGDAKNVVLGKQAKDRVKIIECAISNKYDKDKKTTYWNPVVFKCEDANGGTTTTKQENTAKTTSASEDMMDQELPF